MSSERAIALLERIAAAVERLVEMEEGRRKKAVDPDPDAVSPERLIEVWNQYCQGLPRASGAPDGSTRRRRLVAALKAEKSLERWGAAVRALANSPHHRGQNERGWVANIDFLVQAGQFQKWLEAGAQREAAARPEPAQAKAVWCGCGKVATRGPGTRNPDLSSEPRCGDCK